MSNTNTKMSVGLIHLGNKKIVLDLIKRKGEISRSEIAGKTGLTPPTISRIIDELIFGYNLVEITGPGSSNGGRPPMIVKFKSESNYIIGIDLGATYIRGCLVDLNARFISEIQLPTEIEKGFISIIEKVVQIVFKFQNRPGNEGKIWGVGIGVAGLVNCHTGIIESSPDFGWENIDLKEEIGKRINLPVFHDNSTRLMALGELSFNRNSKLKNFAIINVGYGIAAGLVVDGNLIKGYNGFAGEFGHIPVNTCSNVQCKCGKYGCLEAMASGHRIANLGIEAMMSKNAKILTQLCLGNPNLISAELVGKAAKQDDEACLKIYDEITEYLSQGIGTLANLLNPQVVYIGGGISLNGKFFFDLVRLKVSKYLLSPNLGLKVQPSTFGELATSIGAVSLVLEKIMNLELN